MSISTFPRFTIQNMLRARYRGLSFPVEVLSHEDGPLEGEGVDDGEDAVEGEVQDDEVEHAVDVDDRLGGHRVLVHVHHAEQGGHELE